jgi:hypothetical protein
MLPRSPLRFRILFDSTRRICMHADSGSYTFTMALEDSPSLGSVCVCVCVCVVLVVRWGDETW